MNEGEFAARLGLIGIPKAAETVMLERDMRLVALTGGRYHAASITCAESLDVLRRAKDAGLTVTASASINHLTLNENDIGPYRTFFKLSPPLRAEDDRKALVEALAEGLIDVVMSDHNPQDVEVKRLPFAEAAAGAIGLETMLTAGLRLVHTGEVKLTTLLRAMSTRPAELLGLPGGTLRHGAAADVIVIDIDMPWVLDPAELKSKCNNTPFDEARLTAASCAPSSPAAPSTNTYDPYRPLPSPLAICSARSRSASSSRARPAPATSAHIGSGNIGATNVLRTGRKGLAGATLLCDMLKGTLAVIGTRYCWHRRDSAQPFDPQMLALVAGLGAFLGHLFPVWLKFKGGKGVATYIGVLLGLYWPAALIFGALWLAVAALFRYSSLAALVASALTPPVLLAFDRPKAAALFFVLTSSLDHAPRQYPPPAQRQRRQDRRENLKAALTIATASGDAAGMITARFAGEQGREVFAVPGSPLDPRAEGTNGLLKQGAILVTEAADVIAVLEPILGRGIDLPAREFGHEPEPDRDAHDARTWRERTQPHHWPARPDTGRDRRSGAAVGNLASRSCAPCCWNSKSRAGSSGTAAPWFR